MKQQVKFKGGQFDGRMAVIRIEEEFKQGMELYFGAGIVYTIRPGPIAESIEKSQEPMEFGMVVLIYKETTK